jgi:hypothetical protein
MKIPNRRVPYGHEKKLIQVGADSCVRCKAHRGENHKYGCDSEECPQCGSMIIGCCCDCLSNYESSCIIQALCRKFSSLEDALSDMVGSWEGRKSSYLDHAAVQYIFENVPKDVRSELVDEFRRRFPLLLPHIEDAQGTPYYTAEQLSKTLNVPLREVQEKVDAMVEAGKDIRFLRAPAPKKVH